MLSRVLNMMASVACESSGVLPGEKNSTRLIVGEDGGVANFLNKKLAIKSLQRRF